MTDEPRRAIAFRVRGRVQGVGFRDYTRRRALELGLVGWVRNEPDGSVAGEAVGTLTALDAFREAVEKGPRLGRVDAYAETPLADVPAWTGFAVRF